jgi:peptidoglycan hydrolase CwlO-like protein
MRKQMIVGIAMATGILAVGAFSASAAEVCVTCADKQAVRQFTLETAALTGIVQAKDRQLRELYSYDSIDMRTVNALEREIRELKEQISTSAQKYDIHACSHS